MNKIRILIFFLGLGLIISFTVTMEDYVGSFVMLAISALAMLVVRFPYSHISKHTEELLSYPEKETITGDGSKTINHVYYGDELDFSDETITTALTRHFPYFTSLDEDHKTKFIGQLNDFIADKTFIIHDRLAFREMPILISASAIQLSFGLQKYLLPYFSDIHVYPDAFERSQPSICLLEGNVSEHTINISWKHFLDGYENPGDGENVALHEMAHALFYQAFTAEENFDTGFRDTFNKFSATANPVYNKEKNIPGGLYSDYAVKNFQDFWAASVELFFEKPQQLNSYYPRLLESMKSLLNQDPLSTGISGQGQ
jgi:Mlc titration factor MtfA (ptsG expression regulator)